MADALKWHYEGALAGKQRTGNNGQAPGLFLVHCTNLTNIACTGIQPCKLLLLPFHSLNRTRNVHHVSQQKSSPTATPLLQLPPIFPDPLQLPFQLLALVPVHANHLRLKHKHTIRRNRTHASAPIRPLGLYRQRALLAGTHVKQAFVPAFYDLTFAKVEGEGLVAGEGGIEFGALCEESVSI